MSAPLSIDAYDAQMLDFSSDTDVPMHITGSADFFAETLMDHDDQLSASTYGEHASVEVDMEEYDIAEYEMAEETAEYHRSHGDEPLDVEVYDASHVPSPLVSPQPLQPPVDVPIEPERSESTRQTFAGPATLPEVQVEPESEVPAPVDHQAADDPPVEPPVSREDVLSEAAPSESAYLTGAPTGLPVSESHEQLGDTPRVVEQLSETPAPAVDEAALHDPPVAEEHPVSPEVAQHETYEPPTSESAPIASAEEAYDGGLLVQDEKTVEQSSATEGEVADPLHISDGVYIDPPPAVLLSIADHSQPEFVLFNQPEVDGRSIAGPEGKCEAYSLLLENRPTLYYEPLSSVFEALRQDEGLLSRIPQSYEGELVLDAYDLQLAASEDNVHSREISLHDLNVLHDGSDFVGHLRLNLRAAVPRFIIRFYAIQKQIDDYEGTNAGEGGESAKPESLDADQVHATTAEDTDAAETVTGHGSEVGDEQTEYLDYAHPEEDDERYGEELPERAGGASPVQYGEPLHDEEEEEQDTSTAVDETQVTLLGSEEGASPVQYGEPLHYEEEGEQDTSTAVDETPVTLLGPEEDEVGPEEDEEDGSAATPVPARVDPEPEASELAGNKAADVSISSQQDTSNPSSEELRISESANGIVHEQATSNREGDATQANIFSEVDESDSNFVSLLEREADAEFERTFNAEQNEQEGSIEATLQQEINWDEWDDEDAEGEDDEDWIDPDAASNESSITLSSKASSKRSYDEVDPSVEILVENADASPGFKRPRVQ